MIVLDTNVLSEMLRPRPSTHVAHWVRSQPRSALFTTAVSEGELFYGIELLPPSRRRTTLEAAIAAMFLDTFAGRVLPHDSEAAREYGDIAAARRRAGNPIAYADAQIAAITRARGADLATRDTDDFANCGIRLINPWQD